MIATYAKGPLTAWSNVALSWSNARGISGGLAEVTSTEAAYVATHRVPLDTDQRVIISAGTSYLVGPLLLAASVSAASGTPRSASAGPPNGGHGPAYVTADLAAVVHLRLVGGQATDIRLDLRNVTDSRVSLSDGTGLAAGTRGYTEPRGLYVGIEQGF